jgi:hypothetical protein
MSDIDTMTIDPVRQVLILVDADGQRWEVELLKLRQEEPT